MFSGYNPLWYKLFVWTLSAVICGIAGALYVPAAAGVCRFAPLGPLELAVALRAGAFVPVGAVRAGEVTRVERA